MYTIKYTFFRALSIHDIVYGVPSGPSRFYSVISTRENSKVRKRKVETTKTKARKHEDENAKT